MRGQENKQEQVDEGGEGANIGGDHSFIKRGVRVDREDRTVDKTREESRLLMEEEIEKEIREVIKESRLQRKKFKETEWRVSQERKEILGIVDNSEREAKQKVKVNKSETGGLDGASCPQGGGRSLDTLPPVPTSTGLGEPPQNSGVQKAKQRVSPGVLKFKKIFEKEDGVNES